MAIIRLEAEDCMLTLSDVMGCLPYFKISNTLDKVSECVKLSDGSVADGLRDALHKQYNKQRN